MSVQRAGGSVQLAGDPATISVLRAHQWDRRAKGCSCGWTQKGLMPRGREQHNHPHHVAAMIATTQAGGAR